MTLFSLIAQRMGVAILPVFLVAGVCAQEVLYTPSATAPGKGVFVARQSYSYERYEGTGPAGAFELDQLTILNSLAYGATPDLTLMLHLPVAYRDFDEPGAIESETLGIKDIQLMFKYRFYRDDAGAIDTLRMSLLGGVEVPSFDDEFSSDSFDPFIGWALTKIVGRHGLGASAQYKWNTGDGGYSYDFADGRSDAVRLDGSYLYRIDPAQYDERTTRSTYFMVELNNRYETNGDVETLVSPGLLIEAQSWAAEFAVRLPLVQELDHRAEMDWAFTVGLRFSF